MTARFENSLMTYLACFQQNAKKEKKTTMFIIASPVDNLK